MPIGTIAPVLERVLQVGDVGASVRRKGASACAVTR